MLYCMLYVLCVVLFLQLMRYAQRQRADVLSVSAVNYVFAAVVAGAILVWFWPKMHPEGRLLASLLGGTAGILYFVNLLITLAAYRLVGVGITSALASMSAVVPVVVSWAVWAEPMSAYRWIAVGLMPVAMLLLRPVNGEHHRMTVKGDLVLMLAFLVPGLVGTIHKALTVYVPTEGPPLYRSILYQAVLFAAAGASSVAYLWLRRLTVGRQSLGLGVVIGLTNVGATLGVLLALSVLSAVVVYPTAASLIVGLSVVAAWLLWHERVTARQVSGLALAVGIVILTNVG